MNHTTVYFVFPGDLETPTGGYHYDRRLIAELRNLGLEVHTVSLPQGFPFPDEQARQSSSRLMAALPDDAVVIVDGLAFGVLDDLAAAEARRLRLIALCHHPLALESGLSDTQRQAFLVSEHRALNHARAILVTSPNTRDLLVSTFSIPGDRICVALPGTDPVPMAPGDGDPVRLLTVASLIPRKAHDVLIDALAPLQALSWSARFVGSETLDPQWAQSLRERVNRLQLADRIRFTGPLNDLQAEYRNADVFVLPSRFEGYGMVFAEALAAGLPIIAARAGAVPDVVPESAGLLVAADDARALSAAITRVLNDRELRLRLRQGARAAANSLPSWSDAAKLVAGKIREVQGP